MKFKEKLIENYIMQELGIFSDANFEDNFSDGILDTIEKLFVSNTNILGKSLKQDESGKPINIDLDDLSKLKQLKILRLKGFKIDERFIKVLNCLKSLSILELSNCYEEDKVYINLPNLQTLLLISCNIKNHQNIIFPKKVIITSSNIDLSDFSQVNRIESLTINNSTLCNFSQIEKFSELKELNLDGTKIDDEIILEKLSKKMLVSHESEFNPII